MKLTPLQKLYIDLQMDSTYVHGGILDAELFANDPENASDFDGTE
jgi:hypothetical protein